MRLKFTFASLLAVLMSLLFAFPSCAESWRWTGDGVSGNAEVKTFNSVRMVAVNQIANGLGYKTEIQKEELLVRAKVGMRFVNGASAVWLGYDVLPLKSRTRMDKNGRWWVAADSALKVFSQFLSKNGRKITLKWAGAASPTPEAKPEVKPKQEPRAAVTKSPLPNVTGLRWGRPTHGVIRAVLDLDGNLAPKYNVSDGLVSVSVSTVSKSILGPSAKYSGIVVKVKDGNPAIIEFTFSGKAARVFTLKDPHRLVVDFSNAAPEEMPVAKSQEVRVVEKSEPVVQKKPVTQEKAPAEANVISPKNNKSGRKLVVIDAGHGGKDPGAIGNGYQEKKIALQIATRLANEVRKHGINVKMTRTGDTYPTLRERTTMANNWNADVFISVHLNALPKGRHSKGVEIYLMALPTDKDAMELAKIENAEIAEDASSKKNSDSRTEMLLSILGNMQQNAKIDVSTTLAEELYKAGVAGKLNMKRVAQAPFWVLRGAAMPSVLIETGFITELSEVRRLAQADYQQKMAEAFASGIVKFLNR